MFNFYRKAALILLGLLIFSLLVAYICVQQTFVHKDFFPAKSSDIDWTTSVNTDASLGGTSSVTFNDVDFGLDFEFVVTKVAQYPFASVAILFLNEEGQQALLDLSEFSSISFSTKCDSANVLSFIVTIKEDGVTSPDDFVSHRTPMGYFSCSDEWKQVEIDLTRLETPQWWLDRFNLDLSMTEYSLKNVLKMQFGSSFQSALEVPAKVKIRDIRLVGREWYFMYILGGFLLIAWSAYGFWFFRKHTQSLISNLQNKMQKDRPLVAYQQISLQPHYDKERAEILRFMATEYTNPDLGLDIIVSALGVNRTKVNETLKVELGYTFTAYLNKLRLSEAARLLELDQKVSISEVAYSVGYKNVSYFNKLFKDEFGCTPKVFANLKSQAAKINNNL